MGKRKSLGKDRETKNEEIIQKEKLADNTDEELQELAKQASKMAKKLKKSPNRLSLNKNKPVRVKVEPQDEDTGESPKKRKANTNVRADKGEEDSDSEGNTQEENRLVSQSLNASQTPKSRQKKIPSCKQVKTEAPVGFGLTECCEGQLWAEDLDDSELWLVRMPAEFDVKQLQNAKPSEGSSLEVSRSTKDRTIPHVVEIQAVRNSPNQKSSYSVLLPSKQNKAPQCVGGFVGEIQVTSHVITKPSIAELRDRKKRVLPDGLKMRNIPFGAGVAIPSWPQVEDASQSSQNSDTLPKRKKEKKKKKGKQEEFVLDAKGIKVENIKKEVISDGDSQPELSETFEGKKKQKDFVLDVKRVKVENMKKEIISDLDSQPELSETFEGSSQDFSQSSSTAKSSKKKKKKHKEHPIEESGLTLEGENDLKGGESPSKKRKILTIGEIKMEEELVKSKKKKKHKDKRKE